MITNKELAQALGISQQHLCYIKYKQRRPSLNLALRLEKQTGIPRLTWLYGTTDEIREQLEHFFTHGKREKENTHS